MAITLIVEDGSIVADANTFVDVEDVQAFATNRGVGNAVVTAGGDPLAAIIIQSADYINSFECRLKGIRTVMAQTMCYPRDCVLLYASADNLDPFDITYFPDTEIPNELKNAQCLLACLLASGAFVLYNNNNDRFTIVEKTADIEDRFSERVIGSGVAQMPQFKAYMKPLLKGDGYIRVVRG